ncbi:MAG: FecR domain-containing protein [Planctomycetes bacterium]|nr:FecR domain-containing protein [Planctomycetota bacterium]
MTEQFQPSLEFIELLVAVTEGDLDAAQRDELNEIINNDAGSREYYVEYVSLHAMLELQHHRTPTVEMPLESTRELLPTQQSNWTPFISFAIAASLLFAVVHYVYNNYGPGRNVVATLIDGSHFAWQNADDQPLDGSLKPGRGQIVAGRGNLELSGGVLIVMQGPADFELLGEPNRFKFDRGVMRAVVPPEAEGFTVIAGGIEIVDLGTEFGLSVDKHNDVEVHVFKGSVRVANKITLVKDEGQGINHKGEFYKPRREAKTYPPVK